MDTEQNLNAIMDVLGRLYEQEIPRELGEFYRGETKLLYALDNMGADSISPSELSDKLGITRARITAAVTALEKKGFVSRTMDAGDRRRMEISLTPAGRTHIYEKYRDLSQLARDLFSHLSQGEIESLIAILQKIADLNAG